MKLRLPENGAINAFATTVAAEYYNPIRLAQLRERGSVEMLLGARGLHVHLDPAAWLVTDRNLGDIPLLAWTGLNSARRDGVHRAMPCELVYYHAYAAVIVRTVLPDVIQRLARKPAGTGQPAPVLAFQARI